MWLFNNILFQPATILKSLQESHSQKQKHLTGSSGSLEQCGALREGWHFVCDFGLSKWKKEMYFCVLNDILV